MNRNTGPGESKIQDGSEMRGKKKELQSEADNEKRKPCDEGTKERE